MSRLVQLSVAVLLLAAVFFVAWTMASSIDDPAQVAADAAAPVASPVTAHVEMRSLDESVTTRGQLIDVPGQTVDVSLSANHLSIVTSVPATTPVREGDVLIEVSGRPVIVMKGAFGAYRDLAGGDTGPDVEQLQLALTRLGFEVDIDGVFGRSTQNALGMLYESLGYQPLRPNGAQGTASARDLYRSAQATTTDLKKTRDDLSADLQLDPDNAGLADELDVAKSVVESAQRDQSNAWRGYAEVLLAEGVSLPMSEVLFVPELEIKIEQMTVAVGDHLEGSVATVAQRTSSERYVVVPLEDVSNLDITSATFEVHDPSGSKSWELEKADMTEAFENVEAPGLKTGEVLWLRSQGSAIDLPSDSSVLVNVATSKSSGAVLALPVGAVWTTADGQSFVTVLENSLQTPVTVEVGRDIGGWVEVLESGAEIQAGTFVIIGQRLLTSTTING